MSKFLSFRRENGDCQLSVLVAHAFIICVILGMALEGGNPNTRYVINVEGTIKEKNWIWSVTLFVFFADQQLAIFYFSPPHYRPQQGYELSRLRCHIMNLFLDRTISLNEETSLGEFWQRVATSKLWVRCRSPGRGSSKLRRRSLRSQPLPCSKPQPRSLNQVIAMHRNVVSSLKQEPRGLAHPLTGLSVRLPGHV